MVTDSHIPIVAALETRYGYASVNGITLHYLEQGRGPPVIMLHGFPDHSGAWRPIANRLAGSYRVIAPDLRGYGDSERPTSDADYRLDVLVNDIVGLLDALNLATVCLCGHDWGGVLAFALATAHPDRIAALIALNAPPLGVLQAMIWHDPQQRAASQYINDLRAVDARARFNEANVDGLIEQFLGGPLRQGALTPEDVAAYRHAWTRPGVWQAMLAWYRAAPLEVPSDNTTTPSIAMSIEQINCPVLVIWGDRDEVFVPAMADAIAAACRNARVERLAIAGHMPHRDAPDQCGALIKCFLANHAVQ